MSASFRPSVCPHDCPSVCALHVEIAADGRIGRVRGGGQPYTDGVICAKVARYAERANHPQRLLHPLVRVGAKGEGPFLLALMMQRASFMHGIVRKDPSQWANADGWINRLLRLQNHLLSDVVGEVVA